MFKDLYSFIILKFQDGMFRGEFRDGEGKLISGDCHNKMWQWMVSEEVCYSFVDCLALARP